MQRKKKKNRNEVGFFIYPTDFQDYDIVAIGSLAKLKAIKKKWKRLDLIKRSKFNNIPLLICDSVDTIIDAQEILSSFKKKFYSDGGK